MKTSAGTFEMARRIQVADRMQRIEQPVIIVIRDHSTLDALSAPDTRNRLWSSFRAAQAQGSSFWEQTSYLALWFIGWATVALSLF